MSLTIRDIKQYIPVDCIIEDNLLNSYLSIVMSEVDLQLENIFVDPLTDLLEADLMNYGTSHPNGSDFIHITAWQETDLVIKRTNILNSYTSTLTETPLVLGQDYILWFGWQGKKIPGITLPVTAISLFNPLCSNEILRVYGTYGWQAGYPNDVKLAIANIVVSLSSYATTQANNGGENAYTRIKSMTTEIEMSEAMVKDLRDKARSFTQDTTFINLINKYTLATKQSVYIV
jgi:hypothetical protein